MKKYIIRNIGWPHNDSTFEPDGEHSLVEMFSDLQQAEERLAFLNREFFLCFFDNLRRFQSYGDFRANYEEYNNRTQKALVEKFGFNPSINLYHHFQSYSIFMFYERPEDKELDELISIFNVDFFTINEIDGLNYFEATMTNNYLEKAESLFDYHGMKTMYFKSKKDAYQRFVETDFDNYLYILNQSESFIGSKEELSELPNLLDSLITECKALEYKDNRIILSSGIDTNSFTQLNEILTKPILDFDTIPITELEVYPESDIKDKLESNRSDWNTIKERNSKFDSKEDYFDDESYLLSYTFPLNMDSRYYEYSDILTNYLKNFFDEKEFSDFRYNDRYVTFYGVIKRIFKEEPELIIETTFGVNRSPIISIHKSVYTSGNNIQDAFYNGLKEWLKLYGKDLVKEIKTEHNTV